MTAEGTEITEKGLARRARLEKSSGTSVTSVVNLSKTQVP
jgi:hypothetical protein